MRDLFAVGDLKATKTEKEKEKLLLYAGIYVIYVAKEYTNDTTREVCDELLSYIVVALLHHVPTYSFTRTRMRKTQGERVREVRRRVIHNRRRL